MADRPTNESTNESGCMTSTTQQILCCVGTTVASRPTQFIMERAFATMAQDWRALTVEVLPEKFSVALEGMAAMGFRALRIYPSLSHAAAELLCSGDCCNSFVGNATSAHLIDGHWVCWDNTGFGTLEWLTTRLEWSRTALCLDGNGLPHRSLIAAIAQLPKPPHAIVWSRAGVEFPAWLQAPLGNPGETCCSVRGIDDFKNREAAELFELASEGEPAVTSVLFVGDDPSRVLELPLEAMSQAGIERVYVMSDEAAGELSELAASAPPSLAISLIPTSEILTECESYDFAQWTGQQIDRSLVRDAYDEFSDF